MISWVTAVGTSHALPPSMSEKAETPAADAAEQPKPKKGGKLIPILLVVNVLVAGGGVGFMVLNNRHQADAQVKAAEEAKAAEETEIINKKYNPMIEVKDLTANLDGEEERYVKMAVNLELRNEAEQTKTRVEAAMIPIRSTLLRFLASKKAEEVVGHEQRARLENEVLELVNETVGASLVENVYVTEFVVQ